VRTALAGVALIGVLAPAVHVFAQAPIINAVVEHRSATRPLAQEIDAVAQRGTAAWIGYRVPILAGGSGSLRSSPTCCGRCRLEPPTDLVVLARVEGKRLVGVRSVSVDCDIDASGAPLVWLDNVSADQSVAWLSTLATGRAGDGDGQGRINEAALTALALHADAAAGRSLLTIARNADGARQRGQALFWLAQRAANVAVPAITAAIDSDPDTAVKRQAVFALSQMPKDEGIPRLIELARSHRNPDVRRQAMFWLGQSKDPRAVEFFAEILK